MTSEEITMSVMLAVRNVKKTLDFYEKVLGFTLGTVFPDREHAQYADAKQARSVFMFESFEGMNADLKDAYKIKEPFTPGEGVVFYLEYPGDIDEYYKELKEKGVDIAMDIKDQPYGIRNFIISDPDGYLISFGNPSKAAAVCLSCGMPLATKEQHALNDENIPYCKHCTDEEGRLKSFKEVLKGLKGFMISQGVSVEEAEEKAREHLKKMPAWADRP